MAVKWTDELRIYGEGFVGRKDELATLDRAWAEGVRIFALHAEGGAGKTRVAVEWLRRMRDDGWRGAGRVFVHSFYSQGSDERRNASSELFFEQALAFFGYRGEPITQADERGRRLAEVLLDQNGLLVLDGLEPLQHPTRHAERGRLKDPGIARLLLSLANVPRHPSPGLCLITSRQPVIELQAREGATVIQRSLDHLHRDDGMALLRQFEVAGPDEELRRASDEFHGHAYSLMLLGSFLKNATEHHDIRRRREVVLLDEDTEQGGHARRMFAAYVRHLGEDSAEVAVLRLLGFFDRPAEQQLLDVLRAREGVAYRWIDDQQPTAMSRVQDLLVEMTAPLLDSLDPRWRRILGRLRDLRLIGFTGPITSPAVDAHPLLRECFSEQVRLLFPNAWQAGHRRLFEHLSGTARYWPEGIEGLQPLYQAVAHGCLAGLHQQILEEVYHNRILRGSRFYSTRGLGATGADLGAVACFFVKPWTELVANLAPVDKAWLLSVAAFNLWALGRLTEAVEPMRVSRELVLLDRNWKQAAQIASNLSELELLRGEISTAVETGEQSVMYAIRSGDAFWQMASRTTRADAMYQAGRFSAARQLFEEAESSLNQHTLRNDYLSSLPGFRYCDLLLFGAERMTWQRFLDLKETGHNQLLAASEFVSDWDRWKDYFEGAYQYIDEEDSCSSVIYRASRTLEISTRNCYLLDIALDHLTLARALLYKAKSAVSLRATQGRITAAVDGIRAAGDVSRLPLSLLTRAWIRCLSGDEPGARADLDEAWEIAERGPMPLFQADIHLYRARLFRDRAALEEARRLIEKHGYHRRDGELADALAAAEGW